MRAKRPLEAFDHLRYTWTATPGMGGERELARALAVYYQELGLTAKAGAYLWMYSRRMPEDPSIRITP